jgi:hypothetical protein
MASTFQSSAPALSQPTLDARTGMATVAQPAAAPTDARQQYLDEQKARESAQTTPTDARQQTTSPAARTPAVVTFIPYAETVEAQKVQADSNLALWAIGGLLAYQLLKK